MTHERIEIGIIYASIMRYKSIPMLTLMIGKYDRKPMEFYIECIYIVPSDFLQCCSYKVVDIFRLIRSVQFISVQFSWVRSVWLGL